MRTNTIYFHGELETESNYFLVTPLILSYDIQCSLIKTFVNTYTFFSTLKFLTLLLLNTTCPVLANSVDPDQLASEEAN